MDKDVRCDNNLCECYMICGTAHPQDRIANIADWPTANLYLPDDEGECENFCLRGKLLSEVHLPRYHRR